MATFRVVTDALNVRAGPGTGNAILVVVEEGDTLAGTGTDPVRVDGSNWLQVRTASGVEGWVHSGFVVEVEDPTPRFRVTAAALNLRAEPNPDSAILQVLLRDAAVVAAGQPAVTLPDGNTWINVATGEGLAGWVNSRFVADEREPVDGGPTGGLAWGAKVSAPFRERVRRMADTLGCEADFLMAAMAFETGETFSPSIKNPVSGATGLIQFMGATAIDLGTTVEALAAMTDIDQLEFVEKYLRRFAGDIRSVEDVYMSILWPRAVGEPNSFILFAQPSIAYEQNAGLDANGDGAITKAEAAAKVVAKLEKGRRRENLA